VTAPPSSGARRSAIAAALADVGILYGREMRAALRERSIVVNSLLIPTILYPFLMWALVSGLTLVQGQTEGFVSRVAVVARGAPAEALVRELRRDERFQVVSAPDGDLIGAVRRGEVDAVLELAPGAGDAAQVEGSLEAHVTFNGSRERSRAARQRLEELLGAQRREILGRWAAQLGVGEARWQRFALHTRNLATGEEMGAFLLGLMLPLFFVIMVAVGCFSPAVDATAGERERHTWETTMSLATSRIHVVAAKYLVVTTFGFIAGVANLTAMSLSLGVILKPLLGPEDAGLTLHIPPGALPILAGAALLLAAFVAAGMLLFASFARTFKEGQAMITPFYMLILLPAVFLAVPGVELSLPLALLPVVNVALLVREAIAGTLHWQPAGVAVLSSMAAIALCVRLAALALRFEDVVMGSYGGSLAQLVKQRFLHRFRGAT